MVIQTDHLNMTIAVDWDEKPQTIQNIIFLLVILEMCSVLS